MKEILVRCICAGALIGAIAACGGGAKQFRLLLEQKPPAEQKPGDVLYDPLDAATCREILKSRSFYERYLRVQLNRRNYHGTWEDFWLNTEVIPDAGGFALVVVFHLREAEANPQGLAEALGTALNEYYAGEAIPGRASHLLVKAVERVK